MQESCSVQIEVQRFSWKNTEGEAKRRGRNPTKNVQQQYKQKKETKVSPRLINFVLQCTND